MCQHLRSLKVIQSTALPWSCLIITVILFDTWICLLPSIANITVIWLFGKCGRADTLSSLFNPVLERRVHGWLCGVFWWVCNSTQSDGISLPLRYVTFIQCDGATSRSWCRSQQFNFFLSKSCSIDDCESHTAFSSQMLPVLMGCQSINFFVSVTGIFDCVQWQNHFIS